MAKGTRWWPPLSAWNGAILFYETSEDAPSPHFIKYWFRNFAAQGILASLSGILLARPDPQGDEAYQDRFEATVIDVLAEEGLHGLPVLSGLDFGPTQPMLSCRMECKPLSIAPAQLWRWKSLASFSTSGAAGYCTYPRRPSSDYRFCDAPAMDH